MQPDVKETEIDDEIVDQVEAIDDENEEEEDLHDQTIVMSEDDFAEEADVSMEVNVEKLVAELENSDSTSVQRRSEIRRRLEELVDDAALEDTYAIEFD